MSRRTLLAIGYNDYDHLTPLAVAEADAQRVFETLLAPDVGDYDPATSRLLRSPSFDVARDALKNALFEGEELHTLTLFFAGHGVVSAGSFYMALRDSEPRALSASALSLADVFRMAAEATPAQTYIIMDACQSGGLIADLNVILKGDVLGRAGSPGISLLAMSASDEAAFENETGGIGTTELLACITGKAFIQDSSATLDLVEIGRAVSQSVSSAGGQTPVVWGLNLYGPPSFCKNPSVATGDAPLRNLVSSWPDLQGDPEMQTAMEALAALSTSLASLGG